jgi:hypothetical protein
LPTERLIVWKQNGALFCEDEGGHESRHESVLRLIGQASEQHDLPDFPPVVISTADRPVDDTVCFSTADGCTAIPAPDFLFDAWPEVGISDYEQACREVADAGRSPASQLVAGWIGNADTHPARRSLLALAARSPLIEGLHAPWPPDGLERLTMCEQVARWGALIDLEGNGWSARLKLLLHSGRPVLVVDRPWWEWWFPAAVPWEHYIPVRRDLADLEEQACWVVEHPSEAGWIGWTGQSFAQRVLTRERAVAEWARILAGQTDQ